MKCKVRVNSAAEKFIRKTLNTFSLYIYTRLLCLCMRVLVVDVHHCQGNPCHNTAHQQLEAREEYLINL